MLAHVVLVKLTYVQNAHHQPQFTVDNDVQQWHNSRVVRGGIAMQPFCYTLYSAIQRNA
jgi:hypothetical protein